MDLRECLKILASRQASSFSDESGCPCCQLPNTCTLAMDPSDKRGDILEDSTFDDASTISLIDALLHVQETRVKTYAEYNRGLETILETRNIEGYPTLCGNMTSSFNKLSESVLRIKEEIKKRECIELVSAIDKVQKAERDKLLYVAALHLDKLQAHLPSLQGVSGNCSVQRNYLSDKIQESESQISEQVQEIISVKMELIENQES